jgi:tetratricopeptide (TPR) repeat protein
MRYISLFVLLFMNSLFTVFGAHAEEVVLPAEKSAPEKVAQEEQESPLVFRSLEQMDELAAMGMPALALRLLSQEQQRWPVYSPDWYAFERKRISLLSAVENWQAIIDRTDRILKEAKPGKQITEQISQWFMSQQIIARLQLQQPEKALSETRKLLWSVNKVNASSSPVALWRRLVIRAYLLMQADDDARRALRRYQQDYSQNYNNLNEDWRLLQARTMLRTNRPEEVITLLAEAESDIGQALRLVAAVRARPDHASLYIKEAEAAMVSTQLSRAALWSYRYVLYEAALQKKNLTETSKALQALLALGNPYSAMGEEFYVGGDELWQLYEDIGNASGNRANLLLGDDTVWYNRASDLQESQPVEALGLYSVLAFSAQDKTKQEMAHKEIVGLLVKDVNGLELINQLYLHGTRVSSTDSLPVEVRYSLVDYALSKSDITLAARLMKSLQKPPQGEDAFKWQMRKARVLILEGSYEQGEQVLRQAVTENELLSPTQIDQFLQVVFDLQAVRRHTQAIEFIGSLKDEWLNDDIRRELLFWKAESLYALEQYASAAWLYLRSAMIADQTQAELWAQSARFKAAGALVKAGLYDDAKTMYTELLRFITSDSRKAFIKQEIQQIRLLKNAETANKEI